jgi:hypothetical protein
MRPNNQNKLLQITTRINIYMKFLIYVAQPEKRTILFTTLTNTHTDTHTLHIYILLGNCLIRINFITFGITRFH